MKVCYCKQASGGAVPLSQKSGNTQRDQNLTGGGGKGVFYFEVKEHKALVFWDETHDTRLLILKDKADISGLFPSSALCGQGVFPQFPVPFRGCCVQSQRQQRRGVVSDEKDSDRSVLS